MGTKTKKKGRVKAFGPDINSKIVVEKILFRMSGDIGNAVQVLVQQEPTWEIFVAAFQDVCRDT